MHTTNIIEGVNRQYRKATKNKSVFPNDALTGKIAVPGKPERNEKVDAPVPWLGSGDWPAHPCCTGERLTQYL